MTAFRGFALRSSSTRVKSTYDVMVTGGERIGLAPVSDIMQISGDDSGFNPISPGSRGESSVATISTSEESAT